MGRTIFWVSPQSLIGCSCPVLLYPPFSLILKHFPDMELHAMYYMELYVVYYMESIF